MGNKGKSINCQLFSICNKISVCNKKAFWKGHMCMAATQAVQAIVLIKDSQPLNPLRPLPHVPQFSFMEATSPFVCEHGCVCEYVRICNFW